jgi:anti-sigma regulatory factor (Ser/Thr protein kinase)
VGALLTGEWLEGLDAMTVRDEAGAAMVRARIEAVCAEVGMPAAVTSRLGLAATELATNQVRHARSGMMAVRAIRRLGTPGVEVIAADAGPGLADPTAALRGRDADSERGASLGIGFSALPRNADEVDLDVRLEEGTCVRVRSFVEAPAARSEVAIYARPYPGERVCGDHAVAVRSDARLTLAVFDGLGHGPPAREAADRAAAAVRAHADEAPDAILLACDRSLDRARGAVGCVAVVDFASRRLAWASAGNLVGIVRHGDRTDRLPGVSQTLGSLRSARLLVDERDLGERDLLCIHTDGVASRAAEDDEALRLRRHAASLAYDVVQKHGRNNDDALVAVVR